MGSENLSRMVEETMSVACDDAKKTRANSTDVKAIGLGFFPVYKKHSRIKDCEELIEKTISKFSDQNFHAMAWCFPPEMRAHVSENNGNTLPGIVLMARNIDY